MLEKNNIYFGDCLEWMEQIDDKSIDCINTNRNYIGFENNKEYYDISIERINNFKESKKN